MSIKDMGYGRNVPVNDDRATAGATSGAEDHREVPDVERRVKPADWYLFMLGDEDLQRFMQAAFADRPDRDEFFVAMPRSRYAELLRSAKHAASSVPSDATPIAMGTAAAEGAKPSPTCEQTLRCRGPVGHTTPHVFSSWEERHVAEASAMGTAAAEGKAKSPVPPRTETDGVTEEPTSEEISTAIDSLREEAKSRFNPDWWSKELNRIADLIERLRLASRRSGGEEYTPEELACRGCTGPCGECRGKGRVWDNTDSVACEVCRGTGRGGETGTETAGAATSGQTSPETLVAELREGREARHLVMAILKYVRHSGYCVAMKTVDRNDDCTCGLDALLEQYAAASASEQGQGPASPPARIPSDAAEEELRAAYVEGCIDLLGELANAEDSHAGATPGSLATKFYDRANRLRYTATQLRHMQLRGASGE